MPAGGPHGINLVSVVEFLRKFLENKGIGLLVDTFILYRDDEGIKQRMAPDLMVMPFRSPAPSSYDLDHEPPPLAVTEITSPKTRRVDMDDKVSLYAGLGISTYLVIDLFTSGGKPREKTGLHLWRKTRGRVRKMRADAEGWLWAPEMRTKVKVRGTNLIFADIETGEILCDTDQLRQQVKQEKQRADQAENRAGQETELRKRETARAERERQHAERLAEKLRALGIDPNGDF